MVMNDVAAASGDAATLGGTCNDCKLVIGEKQQVTIHSVEARQLVVQE